MESWYEVASQDWSIQIEFHQIWSDRGKPKDAALFASYDPDTKVTLFLFSPGAVRIAFPLIHRHNGVNCPPPDLSDLPRVVGDQSVAEDSY